MHLPGFAKLFLLYLLLKKLRPHTIRLKITLRWHRPIPPAGDPGDGDPPPPDPDDPPPWTIPATQHQSDPARWN